MWEILRCFSFADFLKSDLSFSQALRASSQKKGVHSKAGNFVFLEVVTNKFFPSGSTNCLSFLT